MDVPVTPCLVKSEGQRAQKLKPPHDRSALVPAVDQLADPDER